MVFGCLGLTVALHLVCYIYFRETSWEVIYVSAEGMQVICEDLLNIDIFS